MAKPHTSTCFTVFVTPCKLAFGPSATFMLQGPFNSNTHNINRSTLPSWLLEPHPLEHLRQALLAPHKIFSPSIYKRPRRQCLPRMQMPCSDSPLLQTSLAPLPINTVPLLLQHHCQTRMLPLILQTQVPQRLPLPGLICSNNPLLRWVPRCPCLRPVASYCQTLHPRHPRRMPPRPVCSHPQRRMVFRRHRLQLPLL